MNVLSYSDHRQFLRDFAQQKRSANPRWSLGTWSRQIGLSDRSMLAKILRGERLPGPKVVDRLIRYFNFTPREKEHFIDLLNLARLKPSESGLSAMILRKVRERADSRNFIEKVIDVSSSEIISKWYFGAVAEALHLAKPFESAAEIAARFMVPVTKAQVEDAIVFLVKHGIAKQKEDGTWTVHTWTFKKADRRSLRKLYQNYWRQNMELAEQLFHIQRPYERVLSTGMVTIDSSKLTMARDMIHEFVDRFTDLLEDPMGDAVFNLQLQFFPLTELSRVKKKKPGSRKTTSGKSRH